MAQASCRIPDTVEETLQSAADELGTFKSDIIREAIQYYIQDNPRELTSFSNGFDQTANHDARRIYDPVEEANR